MISEAYTVRFVPTAGFFLCRGISLISNSAGPPVIVTVTLYKDINVCKVISRKLHTGSLYPPHSTGARSGR